MEASSRTARTLALVAAVLLAGCKREAGSGPGQPLQPLPAPPAISIAPDALPTAGLTIVVNGLNPERLLLAGSVCETLLTMAVWKREKPT